MADNDPLNDEYQFTELDPMNPNIQDEELSASDGQSTPGVAGFSGGSNVKRNAIIAVVLFIFIMLTYKFVSAYFTDKGSMVTPISSSRPIPSLVQSEPQPIVAAPSPLLPVAPTLEPDTSVSSKLSDIELGQEHLSSEVAEFNGQIGTISSNIEILSNKIVELNRVITALSDKLEIQSHDIERLSVKPVAKVVRHTARKARQYLRYYVQAVIPGRAWLVATNGSTLTVREGSTIAGYGLVKLIDPNQGRVMTSSGQVIRFSQDDS